MLEEAVRRRGNAEVALQLLVDVDEARRRTDPIRDGEAQAVRLSGSMVGILAYNNDFGLLKGTTVKSGKDLMNGGKNILLAIF